MIKKESKQDQAEKVICLNGRNVWKKSLSKFSGFGAGSWPCRL